MRVAAPRRNGHPRPRPIGQGSKALAIAVAVLHAATALAQNASDQAAAEALFDQGKAAMAAKRYAEACPKFFESNRLDQGIGTSLWLADCYEMNGQTASAWAEFREAAGLAAKSNDPREKVARERAKALEGKLARLVLIVPASSRLPGLHVVRDGRDVGSGLWGAPVPTDPGQHAVVVQAPDYRQKTLTITVVPGPGEQALVIPPLEKLPMGRPSPTAESPGARAAPTRAATSPLPAQRIAAIAVGGVGVVGLALGSYFGLHAMSELDASNADHHCGAQNRCDPTGIADRSAAQSAATASTVLFVAGAAALAGGVVLWFTTPARTREPASSGASTRVTPWVNMHGAGAVLGASF